MPQDNSPRPADCPVCPFSGIASFFASTKLTIALLTLSVALLFFATLAGAAYGVEITARAYFGSLVALWQYPAEWPAGAILSRLWLPLPGGPLIAFFAAFNLLFAGGANAVKWAKGGAHGIGMIVSHLGVATVLVGYWLLLWTSSSAATTVVVAGAGVAVAGLVIGFANEIGGLFKRASVRETDAEDSSGLRLNRSWFFAPLIGIVAGTGAYFLYGAAELARMYAGTDLELMPLVLYALALLTFCVYWLKRDSGEIQRRIAFPLLTSAIALHTILPVCITLIRMRPPVTDLHSTLVTGGWIGALFAYYVERRRRDSIAGLAAVIIGFATLLLAYMAGDDNLTSPLSPAIDTTLWLSVHVLVITIGYGFALAVAVVANIHLVRLIFGRGTNAGGIVPLERSALAAALAFGIAGTIAGGLWAERAWGRFWGWDPKENAALMLILWCALALHACRCKSTCGTCFIKLCAATGLVLAWSWAGTNLLASGLHTFGFTQGGAWLLGVYTLMQIIVLFAREPKVK